MRGWSRIRSMCSCMSPCLNSEGTSSQRYKGEFVGSSCVGGAVTGGGDRRSLSPVMEHVFFVWDRMASGCVAASIQ